MNLYPSEPSLSSRQFCSCPAAPALCSPTNEGAQHALRSFLPPASAWNWRMKEVVQKWLNPGTEMAMVILMWFVASLLPFSSCQGAASPVITRFCLIRLYLTASQGHQGLGMGAFVRCSLQLIMINTHLLNTGVTQGQARGLFWLPLSHNMSFILL